MSYNNYILRENQFSYLLYNITASNNNNTTKTNTDDNTIATTRGSFSSKLLSAIGN